MVELVMEAKCRLAARRLCRAHTLAVRAGDRVAHVVGMERAVAGEGRRPLVALLLETLRTHGTKEAVGSQRHMSPTRGRCWATLSHAASPSRRGGLRPSSLAAGMRGRDRGWARGGQRRLADRAGHAQHAAARRAALLFNRRHGRSVVVVKVVAEIFMTWMEEGAE